MRVLGSVLAREALVRLQPASGMVVGSSCQRWSGRVGMAVYDWILSWF